MCLCLHLSIDLVKSKTNLVSSIVIHLLRYKNSHSGVPVLIKCFLCIYWFLVSNLREANNYKSNMQILQISMGNLIRKACCRWHRQPLKLLLWQQTMHTNKVAHPPTKSGRPVSTFVLRFQGSLISLKCCSRPAFLPANARGRAENQSALLISTMASKSAGDVVNKLQPVVEGLWFR